MFRPGAQAKAAWDSSTSLLRRALRSLHLFQSTAQITTLNSSGLSRGCSKGGAASLDGDHLCLECDGTGWVLYRSETIDGEFEEAYRLCPKGHAPRYCMGSSGGQLCPRPATRRLGPGYCSRSTSQPSTTVGILTTLAGRSRGPAARRLRGVSHTSRRGASMWRRAYSRSSPGTGLP
jgi:hypothetical protein